MARTTAIVLNWNGGATVVACLASLLKAGPTEILVVDNGSTDGSPEVLHARFPGVRVLRNERNEGFAKAVNLAIRAASAPDFLWLVNSDCFVEPDSLEQLVECMNADPSVGIVGPVLVEADDPERVQVWGGGRIDLATGIARHVRSVEDPPNYITGACMLLRATMLEEIGLLDEQFFFYWEDVDLSFRARRGGWRTAVAAAVRVPHIEAQSSGRWSRRRAELLFRGLGPFLRRWAPHPRRAVLLRLLYHSAAALRRARWGWLVGAWQGWFATRRHRLDPVDAGFVRKS